MIKKNGLFLLTVLLAIFLANFAFYRIAPVHTVHAGGETIRIALSAGPTGAEEKPSSSRPAQTVVFLGAGLVCVLFSVLAVSPLLLDDPLSTQQEVD